MMADADDVMLEAAHFQKCMKERARAKGRADRSEDDREFLEVQLR